MRWTKFLMINCKEATLLSTKHVGHEITLLERLKLALHNSMCKPCKYFLQQIKLIHQALQSKNLHDTVHMREAKKKEMEELIKNNL